MSTMDIENSSELNNLDLTKVGALQQKRTLAFINQFVISTIQFMNDFSKRCEHSLMDFEKKLEKVEASLILLETKLSSIPELNPITPEPDTTPTKEVKEDVPNIEVKADEEESEVEDSPQPNPEYDRFIKMVQVGVPLPAVKLKLSLEGLDPNVLDKLLGK